MFKNVSGNVLRQNFFGVGDVTVGVDGFVEDKIAEAFNSLTFPKELFVKVDAPSIPINNKEHVEDAINEGLLGLEDLTNKEIIAKLTEAGVTFNPRIPKRELLALLNEVK